MVGLNRKVFSRTTRFWRVRLSYRPEYSPDSSSLEVMLWGLVVMSCRNKEVTD